MRKVEQELDIITFMKQAIYFKVMFMTLFNRNERFLIRKNKNLVIGKKVREGNISSESDSS